MDDTPRPSPDEASGGDGPQRASFVTKVLIVAAIAALFLLAWAWRHVFLLVFASIIIAIGLRSLARPVGRLLHIGPRWGLIPAGLMVLAVIAGIGAIFGRQIMAQLADLSETLPAAAASLWQRLGESEVGRHIVAQVEAGGEGVGMFSGIAGRLGSFGLSFVANLLDAFVVLVAAVFLALNPHSYLEGAVKLLPRSQRAGARKALDASGSAIGRWLAGSLVSMAAMALMISLGLALLGVPAALGLGLIAGIAQFVPLLGPVLAAIPAIVIALTIDPLTAGLVALLYFSASMIEADILYPLIQKKAVKQPPVLTLYSIIAFGILFGPLGVLIAVPFTIVLTIFVGVFYVQGVLHEEPALPGDPAEQRRE